MVNEDYDTIIKNFGIDGRYSKKEVIDKLVELEIIKKGKGLLNKIITEICFRRTYSKDEFRLKFLRNRKSGLYQVITWNQYF